MGRQRRRMHRVENRYRTLKQFNETTAMLGGIMGKIIPVMCVIFVSMGLFLSFQTASESGIFGSINENYKTVTTVRLSTEQQTESKADSLWSGYDPSGGSSQGINFKDIKLSTNSIAVAYGTLSENQLDYLTEYLRATQQAGESANVSPWLLIGLQAAGRDETQIASGVYMPHPGITVENWGKEYNGEILSFLRMNDSIVEESEPGYTTFSFTRSGQHGLLRSTYETNFSRKSISSDKFNFYNSAYSAVKSLAANYQYIDDIQTWYSIGRDSSSKEPNDMITFEGLDKETKWIMAAFMLVEGEAGELYESVPVDMISTFCLQINTMIRDRGFFDDYISQTYGKLEYNNSELRLDVGRELVINYFISKLGWKVSESVIVSEGLDRGAYVSSEILSRDPTFYPGVSMGTRVQDWGKRASTYGLLGMRGTPNTEHYLQNSLSFTDVDDNIMMTLNIDSIIKFVRVIYLGKYYSGVNQYVVNHEQQRLSQNSAQITGGFNISVMPGQDTGVMYYRSYKKMKESENSVVTDMKLLYEIESYQQGKVPTSIYEQINFETAEKVGENYFGLFNEAGWKSAFPLFSQESDPIASNSYWGVGTMGSSGCGLYSFVSLAHGLGLGKEPIPKMKGDTNNGLNEYGFLDPEKVRQIYKDKSWTTTIDHSKVRDLMGYEIQAYSFGNADLSTQTQAVLDNYEAMWSFLKSGVPFVIAVNNKPVGGITYWGESISTKFTTGGHYIILINGAVRNGVRYVEIADCYGGKPTKNNNYTWYNFDQMKTNRQFRHFAYTLSNLQGDGDYIVDLSKRIVQLGDRFVLPDDKLIVAVVKDSDGVEHVRVYRDAWMFLDLAGLTVSSEIDKSGIPAVYDKGTVLGIGNPTMAKGIINRSSPNSEPTYEPLDLGDPEITPYSDIE